MSATKFVTGARYQMRSICDHDCIWSYTVERRTEKSVWLRDQAGKIERKAIRIWQGVEQVMPLGSYSMAPCLNATKRIQ